MVLFTFRTCFILSYLVCIVVVVLCVLLFSCLVCIVVVVLCVLLFTCLVCIIVVVLRVLLSSNVYLLCYACIALSRPHRDSIPDRPARSQPLYRLSYRVH